MRFAIAIAISIVALVLSLTTAFPTHDSARRGLVPDLSGFVFPEIDWEAVHANIAQWNKEREQLLLHGK
jgi:hypothetical protein